MDRRVLSLEKFTLNGETVNRVVLEMNGHNVQVLGYGDSPLLTVLVDDNAEQVLDIALEQYLEIVCQAGTNGR